VTSAVSCDQLSDDANSESCRHSGHQASQPTSWWLTDRK